MTILFSKTAKTGVPPFHPVITLYKGVVICAHHQVTEELWLDLSCLVLSDPSRGITLQAYSQPTPLEARCAAGSHSLHHHLNHHLLWLPIAKPSHPPG